MRTRSLLFVSPFLAAFLACGGSDTSSNTTPTPAPSPSPTPAAGPTITIQGMAYSPQSLQVTPGAVVTVHNLDAMPHSVTSESTPGAYTPGAVAGVSFDTGAFQQQSVTFTIPANAPVGTVIPYYCTVHRGTMATPNGEIRIVAATTATTPTTTPTAPTMPTSPY